MSRLRSLFIIFFIFSNLNAIEVIITTSKINYKELVSNSKLSIGQVSKVKKHCVPMKINDFDNKKFTAKRYLRKGTILCTKDLEVYDKKKNSVLFNFGSIQIERPGKIIFENDKYIKIRKLDGKIEKIYKDGSLK